MMHKTKAALQSCQCHYQIPKQSQHTRVNAGGQRMSRLNIEYTDFIQLSCGAPGILRGSIVDLQINSGRLTFGHRNLLKNIQTGDSRSARNAHNSLKVFQTVNLHSARNPLSQLNYREMRELANWLIWFNSVELTESYNSLIIQKTTFYVLLAVPTKFVGSCEDDGKSHHEENQQSPALDCKPDLAYERVVPQSHEVNRVVTHGYEVNRLSLSESDSLPTDSGLARYLCGSLSPAQNTPEIIVEPPISMAPHSANEIIPVQAKKKEGRSKPLLWLVVCRQTTENPAVNRITKSNPVQCVEKKSCKQPVTTVMTSNTINSLLSILITSQEPYVQPDMSGLSGGFLVFLCCSSLSFFRNDSSGNCIDLAFGSAASLRCVFFCSFVICQPLGSIPRLSNSRRNRRFIHPERLSSPSSFIARFSLSKRSASNRSCTANLSFLLSSVDIVNLEANNELKVTMYTNVIIKATPRTVRAAPRRLTTNR